MLTVEPIPAFNDNYIWLLHDPETSEAFVVDPGDANLAVGGAVEPDNTALAARIAQAEASRAKNEPTVPSDIALELATNPFLRCKEQDLLDSLQSQGRLLKGSTADVFATVRGWKDNF